MPTLSMFYGILIKMFNNGEHNPPHFHAEFQSFKAKFTLDGELMVGEMPRGKVKLIQAWTELHRDVKGTENMATRICCSFNH